MRGFHGSSHAITAVEGTKRLLKVQTQIPNKHKQTKNTEHKHKHMDPLVTTPCYQWSGLAERSGRRRGNKETHLSRATARADGEADEYRVQINCWNCREAKLWNDIS